MYNNESIETLPLPKQVYSIVGTGANTIKRPSFSGTIFLYPQKGNWNVRVGNALSQATEQPLASVNDGSGAVLLYEKSGIPFQVADEVTVRGYGADSVLTYWWID